MSDNTASSEDLYETKDISYLEMPFPDLEETTFTKILNKTGLEKLWNKISGTFVRKPSGGVVGQAIVKTETGEAWGDVASTTYADNVTIENNNSILSVKDLGITKPKLSFNLAVELEIADYGSYDPDDLSELVGSLSYENQQKFVNSWTADTSSSLTYDAQKAILDGLNSDFSQNFISKMNITGASISDLVTLHTEYSSDCSGLVGKYLTLNISGKGEEDFQIVGVEHDNLADDSGKSAFSFLSKDILEQTIHGASSWYSDNSTLYQLSQAYYDRFDSDVKSNIKMITKKTNKFHSLTVYDRDSYIWIPSHTEVGGPNTINGYDYPTLGTVYDYYSSIAGTASDQELRVKVNAPFLTTDIGNTSWFLRGYDDSIDYSRYVRVGSPGSVFPDAYINNKYGLVIGFCI